MTHRIEGHYNGLLRVLVLERHIDANGAFTGDVTLYSEDRNGALDPIITVKADDIRDALG